MSFRINHGNIQPLQPPKEEVKFKKETQKVDSFKNILQQQIQNQRENIKVSSHASKRLAERNISLNRRDLKVLSDAMDKAKEKGAKESLMLYKDMAFIASIGNRTLITAMDPKSNKENVFTNIDSAIIVE